MATMMEQEPAISKSQGKRVRFPTMPTVSMDQRTAKILWRDLLFLVLSSVALLLVSFVETNAPDAVCTIL